MGQLTCQLSVIVVCPAPTSCEGITTAISQADVGARVSLMCRSRVDMVRIAFIDGRPRPPITIDAVDHDELRGEC